MAILICGGAGYIGSHMVRVLLQQQEDVIVLDNLLTGHQAAVAHQAKFYHGDIRNTKDLDRVFSENSIEAVMHFAASSLVGESMINPLKYFDNNIYGMQVLLAAMVKHKADKIVFSSTAAVYGEPDKMPIEENFRTEPTNPYGESKLIMEKMMKWVHLAYGINFVSLRYFNVAGAIADGSIGEDHKPESHLIPLILEVPNGKRSYINIFGDDYPTKDGTCIRDYIHVMDLADAHSKALAYLRNGGNSDVFNLGNGQGFSVKEVINAAEKATGAIISRQIGKRRSGDPAELIASSDKAKKILGWQPCYTKIDDIIKTAWLWHKNNPKGFADR